MAELWLQFAASAAIILLAAHFLARSADTVADRTRLGRSFVGVVMLATATSLPELATGVSAIALLDAPDLAIGDAFGSSLFNLMIIGLADIYWQYQQHEPVLTAVSYTSATIAALGAGLIAIGTIAIYLYSTTTATADWYLSPITVILMLGFALAMFLIYCQDRQAQEASRVDEDIAQAVDGAATDGSGQRLSTALALYVVSAAVVVVAAVWLANTGEAIAETMHWEESFVGTQFLAISTSLPEIGTSFAALRLNAPDLAITNVLGSNVFNMGFVLFFDDLAYSQGTVWSEVSPVHIVSGLIGVLMTVVVITAVMSRPRAPGKRLRNPEGVALVGLYAAASALLYFLA